MCFAALSGSSLHAHAIAFNNHIVIDIVALGSTFLISITMVTITRTQIFITARYPVQQMITDQPNNAYYRERFIGLCNRFLCTVFIPAVFLNIMDFSHVSVYN
jgi:hypothetical protein